MGVDDGAPPTAHQVRFELAGWVTDEDVLIDLEQSPRHQLHEHRPRITHDRDGRTRIDLTVTGPDLWTCTLIAMALIRQAGYEPTAVQVSPLTSTWAA